VADALERLRRTEHTPVVGRVGLGEPADGEHQREVGRVLAQDLVLGTLGLEQIHVRRALGLITDEVAPKAGAERRR